MIGRTRREIGAQTPTAHSDVFARSWSDLLGSRELGCPRMEEVLRAPAAHGVSSNCYSLRQFGLASNIFDRTVDQAGMTWM